MGTLVKDAGLLDRDEYPIRVQVDDPEGVILEENCYPSISDAEDFVKTHYGNVPGVTAYVYELREVYKVVEDDKHTSDSVKEALEFVFDALRSLLDKADDDTVAKIGEILKERK